MVTDGNQSISGVVTSECLWILNYNLIYLRCIINTKKKRKKKTNTQYFRSLSIYVRNRGKRKMWVEMNWPNLNEIE